MVRTGRHRDCVRARALLPRVHHQQPAAPGAARTSPAPPSMRCLNIKVFVALCFDRHWPLSGNAFRWIFRRLYGQHGSH